MTYLEQIVCMQYLYRYKTFTHFSSYDWAMQRAIDLQLHYVVDHPKVGEWLI